MVDPDPRPDPDPEPDPEDLFPTFLLEPNAASTQPGVRRLTRAELRRTVFDATGVDPDVDAILDDREIINLQNDAGRSTVNEPGQMLAYLELATDVAGRVDIDARLPCAATCTDAELRGYLEPAFAQRLDETDLARYRDLYVRATDTLSAEFARRAVVQASLISPKIIYRTEVGDASGELTPHELADKISYFLIGRGPDAELRALADDGTLADEVVLAGQVDRLLADPRAEEALVAFFFDWLGLEHLDLSLKLAADELPEGLDRSMVEEASRMIRRVVFQDGGTLRELLTTRTTEIDGNLAAHYGISGITGAEFQEASLEGTERAGLLTTGLVLAAHAKESGRSPMQRGNFLIAEVMTLGFPAEFGAAAMTLPDGVEDLSFREQFEPLETTQPCLNCHRMLNAGFAFDVFDSVGRRFPADRVGPEETVATFDAPPYASVSFDTTVEAVEGLSRHALMRRSFVGQMFHSAQGSAPSDDDADTMSDLEDAYEATEGDVLALMREIALSSRFRAAVEVSE